MSEQQLFQMKNQGLPERCEICHQSDKFDAEENCCSRCNPSPKYSSGAQLKIVGVVLLAMLSLVSLRANYTLATALSVVEVERDEAQRRSILYSEQITTLKEKYCNTRLIPRLNEHIELVRLNKKGLYMYGGTPIAYMTIGKTAYGILIHSTNRESVRIRTTKWNR